MQQRTSRARLACLAVVSPLAALGLAIGAGTALANVTMTQISSDPFTNSTSQHAAEVEPDVVASGSTIVAAVQQGRFFDGGASDLGFATSTDGGSTWTSGSLPGLTKLFQNGPYDRASDPAVAFDAKHSTWLISGLAISTATGSVVGAAVTVNRSTDGGLTWGNAVNVVTASGRSNLDKEWITCDDNSTSAHFGNCYAEYDDNGANNRIFVATSSNGGQTWTTVRTGSTGLGGQPLVQPGGTVVVPFESNSGQIRSLESTNGGSSWSSVTIATIQFHTVAGNLRTSPLPSAAMDSSGKIYVTWEDCRFQANCPGNDIVMSTSTNGTSWSTVTRVTSDGGDHFIPGIGIDPTTSGATAKIGVAYYFYPTSNCTASTCQLDVGYVSSTNGGSSWSAPTQLAGPMTLSWLANTSQGVMVGDYMATAVDGGLARPAIVIASAPTGSTFNEALFTPTGGLAITGGALSSAATPVVTAGHRPVLSAMEHRR